MGYKVLYRKYRPDDFENVVGQEYTVSMLKKAIDTGKNAHAYIFTGPRGTGKTSSAKIFAKALNCENPVNGSPCNKCNSCLSFKESPDIIEIDAASNNGVDEIRELINNVKLVPSFSKYKVYIIDEVHMLTESAFNALLLTLEEPPSHVVFILATTDIQEVPITILSRCQRFDFKPISRKNIVDRLSFVCKEESIKVTDEALDEIALISAGGMRDALGMLDQLANDDTEISLDMVSSYFGSISSKKLDELLTAIENNDSDSLLTLLNDFRINGINYSVLVEKLIASLRKCAIDIKLGKSKHDFYFDDIYNMIFDLNECVCNINVNIDPYILIEIVLLKYINNSGNKNECKFEQNNFLGNEKGDFPGNTDVLGNKIESKSSKSKEKVDVKPKKIVDKPKVINKDLINLDIRINNCFVDCSKDDKVKLSKSWVDFMNYLIIKDRSLISLLADTEILAASSTYALISSKVDSTNDLINSSIISIEKYYGEYSGNDIKFAAINNDLWQKEVEKYRINVKNQIKYSYMDEPEVKVPEAEVVVSHETSTEDVASDIFGSFDVE